MSNTDQTTAVVDNAHLEDHAVVPSQLRELKDGDSFTSVTDYLGNQKVNAVFSFRPYEKGPRYVKECLFDFSGVTEEQLYKLAMYGAKVKVQLVLRSLSRDVMLDPKTLSTVDVLVDVVQSNRSATGGDPVAAAIRTLARRAGVTEETLREALASVAKE